MPERCLPHRRSELPLSPCLTLLLNHSSVTPRGHLAAHSSSWTRARPILPRPRFGRTTSFLRLRFTSLALPTRAGHPGLLGACMAARSVLSQFSCPAPRGPPTALPSLPRGPTFGFPGLPTLAFAFRGALPMRRPSPLECGCNV